MLGKDLKSNDARNKEKDDDKALESHAKTKQDIVQVTPPSCSPNIFEEVCLASNLPIFRFGQNFIVDASIRKIKHGCFAMLAMPFPNNACLFGFDGFGIYTT